MAILLENNDCLDIYSDIFNQQKRNLIIYNTENTQSYFCTKIESTVTLFNHFKIENLDIFINFQLIFLSLLSINDLKILFNTFNDFNNWHRNNVRFAIMFENIVDLNEVMKICWKYFIINVVVLSNTNIYTYYPYGIGNCGKNITAELLTDSKDIKTINIFPEKIPNDLQRCEVKFGVIKFLPFVNDITKALDDPQLAGFEVTIMHTVAKKMNFVEKFSEKDLSWGYQENITYYEALQMMDNKEIDIIYGYTNTYFGFSKKFDKSVNHIIDAGSLWIPSAPRIEKWKNILVIFNFNVWISLLLTIIEVSIGWWIIANVKKEYLFVSYQKCLLRIFGLLCQNPYKLPKSIILRFTFILWCAGSIVIVAAYTSKLITSLLAPLYRYQITSIHELVHFDFMSIALDIFQVEYFDKKYHLDKIILDKHIICTGFYECLHSLLANRNISIFDSKITMDYLKPRCLTKGDGHVEVFEINDFSFTEYLR